MWLFHASIELCQFTVNVSCHSRLNDWIVESKGRGEIEHENQRETYGLENRAKLSSPR